MSLQSLTGGMIFPLPFKNSNSALSFDTAVTFSASTNKAALVFRSPFTDSIDKILCVFANVTTAANLDYRVETVGTGSDAPPTGTLWSTNTAATGITPVATSAVEGTLTSAASITRGNMVAIVVQPSGAGTISLTIPRWDSTSDEILFGGVPYGSFATTGAYANSALVPLVAVHLQTANEWAFLGPVPTPQTSQNTTINTATGATTGTRRGIRFTLPFPARLSGIWGKFNTNTGADFNVTLYDSGGTLLATLINGVDASQQRAATGNLFWYLPCDADYDLSANTVYRLVIEPTTTNSFQLEEWVFGSSAHTGTTAGGTNLYMTAFISSAWSDDQTIVPMMGMVFSGFDDATGGGGGTTIYNVIGE